MGAIPVSSRWAALSETSKFDLGPLQSPRVQDLGDVESDRKWLAEWVQALITTARGGIKIEEHRAKMKTWARQMFGWQRVAKQWHGSFQAALKAPKASAEEKPNLSEAEQISAMLAKDPNCAPCYNKLGILHDRVGDYKGAVQQYLKSIQIDPKAGQVSLGGSWCVSFSWWLLVSVGVCRCLLVALGDSWSFT